MLIEAASGALRLMADLDPHLVEYASRSIFIALVSTASAGAVGVPVGLLIATNRFPLRRALIVLLNTLLGLPTVVAGLAVYSFVRRGGLFGMLDLLFTVPAIVAGEMVLILPIVIALTISAVSRAEGDIRKTALGLGASRARALLAVVWESRFGILAALVAAYGRVVGEVGVATILGGNIAGTTRTMTTAIVLAVDMGAFELALALGIALLAVSLLVNVLLQILQGAGRG